MTFSDTRQSVACLSGRRVVDVLSALDVHTVLLDDPTPLDLSCLVDVPLDVDLDDWPAAEAALRWLHEVRPLDAVFSVYDAHLPLASYLAASLGTRGLALSAALNCHDKGRMRQALDSGGIRIPGYLLAGDPADAPLLARRLGLPVVVKKRTHARGRGSLLCHTMAEVDAAVRLLGEVPLIVERYVAGAEYAVQTVTSGGVTEVVSVLAQQVGPGPRQLETGYDYPSGLSPVQEKELGDFVTAALAVLGLDHSVAHTQVRVGELGPVLINVAARPPGGQLCAVTERISGIDMTRAAVEIALGRPVTRQPVSAHQVLYRCVTFDEPGIAWYDTHALDVPGLSLDVAPGDSVGAAHDLDGGSYGRIVVYGDDHTALENTYRNILASLQPRVEPDNL